MRETLRDIVRRHLQQHAEDLEHVRRVYPPELWAVNTAHATRQRVDWLVNDVLRHFMAYAADESQRVGSAQLRISVGGDGAEAVPAIVKRNARGVTSDAEH